MPKATHKNNDSKNQTTNKAKTKSNSGHKPTSTFTAMEGKKCLGNIFSLLNYKYLESDLEQFVY